MRLKLATIYFLLAILLTAFLPIWLFVIVPQLEKMPDNFSYSANVLSYDNFYNDTENTFSGEQPSKTQFSYTMVGQKNGVDIIKNIFDVRKTNGEKIFSVERLYGIDPITGQHVPGYGDESRTGYLFAPKNLYKQPFTYWHINYDVPATMSFKGEENLFGLPVYRYESYFVADQTKNLTNLPGVPDKRGIIAEVHLTTWIEPVSGRLIKYQDETTAYYYDKSTGIIIEPWNKFHNTISDASVAYQAQLATTEKDKIILYERVIPVIIILAIFLFLYLAYQAKYQITKAEDSSKIHLHSSPLLLYGIPSIILWGGLFLTYFLWQQTNQYVQNQLQLKFTQEADKISQSIEQRFEIYQNALTGARGLFAANPNVTREEWQKYIQTLNIPQNYPGTHAIAFAKVVTPQQKDATIAQIRAEGFPNFTIFPAGNRSEYVPSIYLEPFDSTTQKGFGYDISSEPTRKLALEKARDNGTSQLTGKITLVSDAGENQPGFVLYVPVYKKNAPTTTIADKQAALTGYVFATFRANDFMAGVLGNTDTGINFTVYNGTIDDMQENNILYSNIQKTSSSSQNLLTKTETIYVEDQPWTIQFFATPKFISTYVETQYPPFVAISGTTLSLLLSFLIYSLLVGRRRAIALAQNITKDLQEKTEENEKTKQQVEEINKRLEDNTIILETKVTEIQKANEALEDIKKATLNILEDFQDEKTKTEKEKLKYEAILTSIGDGILVTDENKNILLINKAAEETLGVTQKDTIGKETNEIIHLEDDKGNTVGEDLRPIQLALVKREKISGMYTYVRPDGIKIVAGITATPIILNEKAVGTIEVLRDITKEREIDRMKTEFISLASHQLRTPLSAMKWFLEMLLNGDAGQLTTEQKEYIDNIDQSNERMIDLVNSLLNVSRIESGRIIIDPVPTDMNELLQGVLKELEIKFKEKHQTPLVSIHPDLPKISIDPKLIRQVYMNLLTNAIKYSPDNGEISIFVSKKDNDIISQISDNGYGIPAKDKEKVFDKFYRGDNIAQKVTDGNGLGLYLVKAIIESSGGKIWFESEENKGTTFWFSVPLSGSIAHKGEVTIDS